jgi:hypothetical protein
LGKEIDKIVDEISNLFKIKNEDLVHNFLGINIDCQTGGMIIMTQPKLIQDIISDLGLKNNWTSKDTPDLSSTILQPMTDDEPFDEEWSNRSVIGRLNYLERSTRPDIAYAVHQCARFASNPRKVHAVAVKHIGRYLLRTKGKGIQCKPNKNRRMQCRFRFCRKL